MEPRNVISVLFIVCLINSSLGQFTGGSFNQPNNPLVTGTGQPFAGTNQNPGTNNQPGNFGQTGTGGNFGQNSNAGQTGVTGNFGQPGTTGNFGQPGTTGNFGQPGTTGNFGQPGVTGNFGQPGATGNFGQPGTTGNFGQGNFGGINNGLPPNPVPPQFPNNRVNIGGFPGGFNAGNTFGNPFISEGFAPGGIFGGFGEFGGFGGMEQGPQTQPSLGGQLFMNLAQNPLNYRYASCAFNSSDSVVYGKADFRQFLFGDAPVDIRIQVWGLPPSPVDTQRGVHIHEYGDISDKCARVGPHFNPVVTRHGGRNTFPFLRHVGDLGNMVQSPQGITSTQFRDNVISLIGRSSVVGRAVVVKFERDDEGLGTNSASTQNGNARTPVACCTIGRSGPNNWNNPWSEAELNAAAGVSGRSSGFQGSPTLNQPTNSGAVQPTPSPGFNFGSPTGNQGGASNSFDFLGGNGKK